MANKPFSEHAQKQLNKNPYVVKCSPNKIVFTEEFALKIVEAIKNGVNPCEVFKECGMSIRVLRKSRINGIVGLYRSKYELGDVPRRKPIPKPKKYVETTAEKRKKNLDEAISYCDFLIENYQEQLKLDENANKDLIHFAAIKKTYDNKKLTVVVKDLCSHYGYQYLDYYSYLTDIKPKDEEYVNILNSHRKKRN